MSQTEQTQICQYCNHNKCDGIGCEDQILHILSDGISIDEYNFLMENYVTDSTPTEYIPDKSTYASDSENIQYYQKIFCYVYFDRISKVKDAIVAEGGENLWNRYLKSIADRFNLKPNFRTKIIKKFLDIYFTGPLVDTSNETLQGNDYEPEETYVSEDEVLSGEEDYEDDEEDEEYENDRYN